MQSSNYRKLRLRIFGSIALGTGFCTAIAMGLHPVLIITTLKDFHQPATQPNTINDSILSSDNCSGCHGNYDPDQEPYTRWSTSMMAQSARDPVFYAALAIANQDAKDSGELCLRCHAPGAWLAGRSIPTNGSALNQALGDFDGVTCNLCHRLVNPNSEPGNPPSDAGIVSALAEQPVNNGGGQYIIDPNDVRRGPFQLSPTFFYHDWAQSPYHTESLLCATCHEVSNPIFTRQPNGTYAFNDFDTPHPTQNKYDEFPIERTYSEWSKSAFEVSPIDMGGRFGGNTVAVSSCQDCHIPTTTGTACNPFLNGAVRNDLPLHDFNGSNSWVLDAVRSIYPDSQTGLNDTSVAAAHQRTLTMLQNAADLYVSAQSSDLVVRIVNQSGHKLPSGYGEGRRMWINVQFYNAAHRLIAERGAYDSTGATLTTGDTRVYESKLGLDGFMGAYTGLPAAESFHFVLNNQVYKDNRIPPRGFTNAAFASVQSAPVAATFGEEHYWDDTHFAIPVGAASVDVHVYHQTSSREYMEFLRDSNVTNQAGQKAYAQWVLHGKSAPVLMKSSSLSLVAPACMTPIPYGTAKTTSANQVPSLSYLGLPSFGAANFQLIVKHGIPGRSGMLLSSTASASAPYHGGTSLVANPTTQVATYVIDVNGQAVIPITIAPAMPGTQLYYQAVFTDSAAADPYGLTNGLVVDFCQ